MQFAGLNRHFFGIPLRFFARPSRSLRSHENRNRKARKAVAKSRKGKLRQYAPPIISCL
jgi:hypothetical protein